ncbi:hypothetical protein M9H77_05125 [Catharanthus roseus]|uniref:Uncharacterized protein n=1 Tax=Catharanthus roseus TaxID=4058 RepID=A0ACC0CGC0_CATRO|nr:hypothetical protein M9H77_05125 [Catharanthus roseus]
MRSSQFFTSLDPMLNGPQPIWNRLLGCLLDLVLGMPGRFGLLLSSSEPFLHSLCLLESSRLLVSPPDPSALPLLFSRGSGVLCFSVVHRPSVSPCLSVGEVRELAREREIAGDSFSTEAITPDHHFLYRRYLDAAMLLLGVCFLAW